MEMMLTNSLNYMEKEVEKRLDMRSIHSYSQQKFKIELDFILRKCSYLVGNRHLGIYILGKGIREVAGKWYSQSDF